MPGVLDPQTVFAVNAGFDDFVIHIGAAIPETGEKFFPSGREYDAFKNLTDIVASAEHSVFLIDPYADEDTIEFLAHPRQGRCPKGSDA